MAISDFRTIFAGVRAARVAVFMDATDPEWQETCRRIIECLSSLWGGRYSLIVPTDGTTISPLFWQLLETYDPDYVVRYHKTARDIKLARPDEYCRMRDAGVRAVFGDEEASEATLNQWEERFLDAAFGTFGISLELESELKQRLAPFFFEQHVVTYTLRAHGRAQYPLTDVLVILPHCQYEDRVALLDMTAVGVPPLWVEAVMGALHPADEKRLDENGIRNVPVIFDHANVSNAFNFIVTGSVHPGSSSFDTDLENLQTGFGPFHYSMLGLRPAATITAIELSFLFHNPPSLRR